MVCKEKGVEVWSEFVWNMKVFSVMFCERGNEPSVSINYWEHFDHLSDS
jgi:hypothetical protein